MSGRETELIFFKGFEVLRGEGGASDFVAAFHATQRRCVRSRLIVLCNSLSHFVRQVSNFFRDTSRNAMHGISFLHIVCVLSLEVQQYFAISVAVLSKPNQRRTLHHLCTDTTGEAVCDCHPPFFTNSTQPYPTRCSVFVFLKTRARVELTFAPRHD